MFILQASAVGLALGVVWEIFESLFFNLTFWDTTTDLLLDTLGAAIAGLVRREDHPDCAVFLSRAVTENALPGCQPEGCGSDTTPYESGGGG